MVASCCALKVDPLLIVALPRKLTVAFVSMSNCPPLMVEALMRSSWSFGVRVTFAFWLMVVVLNICAEWLTAIKPLMFRAEPLSFAAP